MKQEEATEADEALAVEEAKDAAKLTAPDSALDLMVPTVSWFRQLSCVLNKNFYLISRRPFAFFLMMFSSVLSVLLAWSSGRDDPDWDFDEIPLAACGNVEDSFLRSLDYTESQSVPMSFNENWRDGMAVTLMALGPMAHAIAVFLTVQSEIQSEMLGILRGLGLRDSVFWVSWWIPFLLTSAMNAFLGAIAAQVVSVHVYESVYFGGVLGAISFLNLALVGASLMVAAICGTSRSSSATWFILVMIVAVFVPLMVQNSKWTIPDVPQLSSLASTAKNTPLGLFWLNLNTTQVLSNFTDGTTTYYECQNPIIDEFQGNFYKTEEERMSFPQDEWFVGCYFGAGYVSYFWNTDSVAGTVFMFFFPYMHFTTIWANFLGYTAMPNRSFEAEQASWSPEKLAIESLPVPPDEANGRGGTLYPQGSTLQNELAYKYETYYDPDLPYVLRTKDNCPASNLTDYFCPFLSLCTSTVSPAPTVGSPSVNAMFGYLVALAVFYTLVAAYWAQVFPGKNGAPQKFYFFLLPSYWFSFSKSKVIVGGNGVQVQNVSKTFGDFEAIKGVTLNLIPGEVTALLGHNGAGKTTLSSIIGCEIVPTGGDVTVFGHSVINEPYAVRGLVGVCKQFDYLYPNLSAKEHLVLFAGLRGVPREFVAETVDKWLESVDLHVVQNQFSSGFSGGMRRRLSLACATIGGRPLLILDEPTTGMDPVSRRFVWKHIDEIKENRVVLLTTHAMEEADLLSDSVAVMRKGALAAYGTPLELKSEFGSALQFTILVEPEDVEKTNAEIQKYFGDCINWVKVDSGEAGNITVKILKIKQELEEDEGVDVKVLPDFVAWLENKEVSKVSEYGFSNSSLEEVFLKVTEGEEEVKKQDTDIDEAEKVDVCCSYCPTSFLHCCLAGPFRCCCCPKPRVLKSQGPEDPDLDESHAQAEEEGLKDRALDESHAQAEKEAPKDPGLVDNDMGTAAIASFQPALTVGRQTLTLVRFSLLRNWTGKQSAGIWIFSGLFVLIALLVGIKATDNSEVAPFLLAPIIFLSLMLVNLISPIYADRNLGLFYLMRTQGLMKTSYVLGTSIYSLIVQFVFAFVLLSIFFAAPVFRSPDVCASVESCSGRGFGDPRVVQPVYIYWWNDEYNNEEVRLYATWQAGSYGRIFGSALFFALAAPGSVLASAYVPGYKFALVFIVFATMVASVLPMIYYTKFSKGTVEETEDCRRKVCNTPLGDFDFGSLSDTPTAFLDCVGLEANYKSIGSLCIPPAAAVLPQFGLFQTLMMTLLAEIVFVSEPPEYVQQVLIPALGGSVECSGSTCRFPFARKLYGENLGFMLLGAIILLVLGFAQVSFFSFPAGATLRVKNYISDAYRQVRYRVRWPKAASSATSKDASEPMEEVVQEEELVTSIIQKFRKPGEAEVGETGQNDLEIEATPRDELPPVLMHKLRKVYPALGGLPPKIALESLDLHVPKGQVLGLLGKNGAGKTTALKILSISHEATSGLALVAGYDVSCEETSVFERLGNCPQFDIVWPGQSVRYHLEFFASLKGLPSSHVSEIAASMAKAVGLGAPEVYNRHSGQLSGGMRRRLSIAISLIGAPKVLLLDEPSTGLDPSTRNSIWKLVSSFATKERAVIITTHMMLEADILCSRIAIMSRGSLKVIATQQALKDRFGSGYLLQLNLVKITPENEDKAMRFVREHLHKDAVLQTKQAKTLQIALPKDMDLTDVFRVLYSPETAKEGGINQFLLSQSSLEDVFIALGDERGWC